MICVYFSRGFGFWINIALIETLFQVMLQTGLDCIVDMDFALLVKKIDI